MQIVDDLRRQIDAGTLAPGDALPSIAQLCDRYDVSASVVKAAISVLRTKAIVVGQQGKGVFVSEAAIAIPSDDPEPELVSPGAAGEILDELAKVRRGLKDLGDRLTALESAVFQEPKRSR
ncbi:winged helix-turn-helix domain-containing protein [Streptosporangium sp. KLBMP 9127]|nr:winged helix-turn-helix domain-containing protein [Streptosporangium sp. KLBMP 9127]